MKIIDAHVHIYPPFLKEEREKIARREEWFRILTASRVHKWATAEELIEAMDRDDIESSFVTTFAFYDQGLCREMNDYLFDAVRRFPGRIKPMAVVSPSVRGAEAEVHRCADMGAVGIGELFPDGQLFSLSEDSDTWRLTRACDERGLFVNIHTAEQAGHTYPGKGEAGAVEAAKFVQHNPVTKIIFSHFGGGLWAYEAMPEMRLLLQHTYYDTAAMPWLYEPQVISAIFAIGAGDKLLYGSDFPILNLNRYTPLAEEANLSEKDKEQLFYKNAEKFLAHKIIEK